MLVCHHYDTATIPLCLLVRCDRLVHGLGGRLCLSLYDPLWCPVPRSGANHHVTEWSMTSSPLTQPLTQPLTPDVTPDPLRPPCFPLRSTIVAVAIFSIHHHPHHHPSSPTPPPPLLMFTRRMGACATVLPLYNRPLPLYHHCTTARQQLHPVAAHRPGPRRRLLPGDAAGVIRAKTSFC